MKGSHPEQLTGAHLYLDIAKSGYLFDAVGNVMRLKHHCFHFVEDIFKFIILNESRIFIHI